MATLAPKLPWTHPFAGGYPRRGGQPLPTDPDAIDYLNRVAAADGAAVEVGVAMAVDAFVKGCKSDGIWGAIKASCLLCGPRTLSGALVPLVGTAPTSYAFASGDYNRVTGLKGDGSTTYLDSNRANDADGQDDNHWSIYITTPQTVAGRSAFGSGDNVAISYNYHRTKTGPSAGRPQLQNNVATNYDTTNQLEAAGLSATSRASAAAYDWVSGGQTGTVTAASVTPNNYEPCVLAINSGGSAAIFSDARLAFYSIGAALDLAALDSRISTYVAAIAAAL